MSEMKMTVDQIVRKIREATGIRTFTPEAETKMYFTRRELLHLLAWVEVANKAKGARDV